MLKVCRPFATELDIFQAVLQIFQHCWQILPRFTTYSHGNEWCYIYREYCGFDLCPVHNSTQVGLKERWIKGGIFIISSYDFEHHNANASPEWLHFTSYKSVVSNLVEIVSNLNRRRLIKVHIDIELCGSQCPIQKGAPWNQGAV